jgi:hypothetical protein
VEELKHYGTSTKLLVSPSVIPTGVNVVTTPYGETLPVVRLERFWCPYDTAGHGVLTSRIDWTGLEPGTYIEDKFLLKLTILGDTPVTADESNLSRGAMSEVHGYRLKVNTIGTVAAEWTVDEKGRMYPARFSSWEMSPAGMGTVTGIKAIKKVVYDNAGHVLHKEITDQDGNPLPESAVPETEVEKRVELNKEAKETLIKLAEKFGLSLQ